MRIYKPAYTRKLKAGERIRRDKQGRYVHLRDRQGVTKKCRVVETPKGTRLSVESSFWWLVFRDHTQVERRLKAYRDKSGTDLLAERIGQLVYHRQQSESLPAELQEWADALPDELHKQLADFGLVRRRRVLAVGGNVDQMLEHFREHLAVKRQRNERYVQEVVVKLRTMFTGCGFQSFSDIDDVVLDKYLLGLRQSKNLSTRTLNGYVRHMQQFCRFAVRVLKAAKSSPVECMESFGSVAADRRRVRRALTPDEIRRLLTTTAKAPERFGMDGRERSLLYRFALTTGLRLSEIRTLRVEHVDFDHADGPVLYVDAAYSKHRERDVLPLHHSLVAELRRFIVERGKLPATKLFGGTYKRLSDKAADMIRADLADADIEYETVAGLVDFHSLRHSYVSALKSIPSRLAQGLARHKSSSMTDLYTHRSLAEQRAALESVDLFGLAS